MTNTQQLRRPLLVDPARHTCFLRRSQHRSPLLEQDAPQLRQLHASRYELGNGQSWSCSILFSYSLQPFRVNCWSTDRGPFPCRLEYAAGVDC